MSQGRYVNGRLVTEVFVVNQVSGGAGGVTEAEVSGMLASGFTTTGTIIVNDLTVTGTATANDLTITGNATANGGLAVSGTFTVASGSLASDLIPDASGTRNLGSAEVPFATGFFDDSTIFLGNLGLGATQDGTHLIIGNPQTRTNADIILTSAEVEAAITQTPHTSYTFKDTDTDASVTLGVRDGALIVTNPFTESVSSVDLGATTIDPGNFRNVFLNGAGKYAVGNSTLLNTNGLITLEYINAPGQFFVIEDVDGGNFGPGDRQSFGIVRETIVDGTDLDGQPKPLTTGNSGGWSVSYTWYYTGGYPYGWTTYTSTAQTPGNGAGQSPTGTFAGQTSNRHWWELCELTGTGKKMRWGIANGELTDQAQLDFGNRLLCQLYVTQGMIDYCNNNPAYSTYLPAIVKSSGPGWYTQSATAADFEDMGQFPNGKDKGYRFRWSTFGNTTLNQLPYVQGVPNDDQITSATGRSHYVVYNVGAADLAAANSVLASGTVTNNNRFYGAGVTIHLLQYNQPYEFQDTSTPDENTWLLPSTYVGAVEASPLFNNYDVTTASGIREASLSVAPLQKIHADICKDLTEDITAYYLIRNLGTNDTAEAQQLWATAVDAALAGQIRNTYDAIFVMPANTTSSGGTNLFPTALKNVALDVLKQWMKATPDN